MSEIGDGRNPLLGLLEPARDDLLHKILTDLIAELREGSEEWGVHPAADRAAARLREVTGSDDRPCTAALNIAGKHYPCDTEVLGGGTHTGWPHSNKEAEAIWQGDGNE